MTDTFKTIEQLGSFLVTDLYSLYDDYREALTGSESFLNYLEGCIDRTQIVLIKCGIDHLEYDDYQEKVENAKWVKA